MSAQAMKHEARVLIMRQIEDTGRELVERTGDSESQMRLNQGIIHGLNLALLRLDEAYRKLGS